MYMRVFGHGAARFYLNKIQGVVIGMYQFREKAGAISLTSISLKCRKMLVSIMLFYTGKIQMFDNFN